MAGRKKHRTNRPIRYESHFVQIKAPSRVEYDPAEADKMLQASLDTGAIMKMKPNGHCFDCLKKIPPMRRLCGQCNSRRRS